MGTIAQPGRRPGTFVAADFDGPTLVASKDGRRIAVCIPARDEETTVGPIVTTVTSLTAQGGGIPLVDDVVVVDDGSTDATAAEAAKAGARVVTSGARGGGKGQAMRVAVESVDADLLVFVDADVTNFGTHFVIGLLGPLLDGETYSLVKGLYRRPLLGAEDGGGRVTELTAKPAIELLFPDLAIIAQPLAGETAVRRCVLDKCDLADGYAVEMGLLVDVATHFGVASIAQVDLGVRAHRNRPLAELQPQAVDVLRAALERARLG